MTFKMIHENYNVQKEPHGWTEAEQKVHPPASGASKSLPPGEGGMRVSAANEDDERGERRRNDAYTTSL